MNAIETKNEGANKEPGREEELQKCRPFPPPCMLMLCPSSRLHLISGIGEPLATQRRLTVESSGASTSELVRRSTNRAGTARHVPRSVPMNNGGNKSISISYIPSHHTHPRPAAAPTGSSLVQSSPEESRSHCQTFHTLHFMHST